MTVKIKKMEVTGKWFSIWLMYVNGVNLNNHCKPCLKGYTSKKVNKETTTITDVELNEAQAKYYYLCGVVNPFSWGGNFHLAWKEKEGSTITYEQNGIAIELENAERITFSEDDIDFTLKNAHKLEYYSCRNWQFANKVSGDLNRQKKLVRKVEGWITKRYMKYSKTQANTIGKMMMTHAEKDTCTQ